MMAIKEREREGEWWPGPMRPMRSDNIMVDILVKANGDLNTQENVR